MRQCLLYDSPEPGARLIGVEYMISPALYATLDQEERRLWHSHVFEVKSGMLVMPQPSALVPQAAWEQAETTEMEQVIRLYGKVYHLWQIDKGHKLPLGEPQLMTSITAADQIPELDKMMDARDEQFPGTDWRKKKELREHIPEPKIHPGSFSISVNSLGVHTYSCFDRRRLCVEKMIEQTHNKSRAVGCKCPAVSAAM